MNKQQVDLAILAGAQPISTVVDRGVFAVAQPFAASEADPNANSIWLNESDITPAEACQRIQSLSDMQFYFRVARTQVEAGGERNLRNAERITRLCLIHPELGEAAISASTSAKPNRMEQE